MNEERKKLQICLKSCLILCKLPQSPSFDTLWRDYTQEEISDLYYAYMESLSLMSNGAFKDVKVKSNIVEAKEDGFTDEDLAAIDNIMFGMKGKN